MQFFQKLGFLKETRGKSTNRIVRLEVRIRIRHIYNMRNVGIKCYFLNLSNGFFKVVHCLSRVVVVWDMPDTDPHFKLGEEVIRRVCSPSLRNHGPVVERPWTITENCLEVLFYVKDELEIVLWEGNTSDPIVHPPIVWYVCNYS